MEFFDNLADKLMTASDAGTKGQVIVEAEKARDKLTSEDKAKKAEIYIKIMHKVASEGEGFIQKETERVKKGTWLMSRVDPYCKQTAVSFQKC